MDEADIMKVDAVGLNQRLCVIIDKVKRIDEENSDEDSDPRILTLQAEGRLICSPLDLIYRERFRDDPASLAEWDEIIHMCDDLEEEAARDGNVP